MVAHVRIRSDRHRDRYRFAAAWLVALAALTALGGCASDSPPPAEDVVRWLGPNLIGEACRLRARVGPGDAAAPRPGGEPAYDVLCGKWTRSSGRLIRTASAQGGTAELKSYARSGWWKQMIDRRASCRAGQATSILDGVPAITLDCNLRNGGWPYLALIAATGDSVYLADGIPSVLPALESAIGLLSKRSRGSALGPTKADGAPARRSDAIQRLEATLGGRLFGTGDLDDYQLLLRIGSHYNSVRNFAESERRYRQALEISQRFFERNDPQLGVPIMHLALELSNQERFTEAEAGFARADALLAGSQDRSSLARLISYRALHAMNQRKYRQALVLSRRATALRRDLAREAEVIFGTGVGALAGFGTRRGADRPILRGPADQAAAEIAHSLHIEAWSQYRLGRADAAKRANDEAIRAISAMKRVPSVWRADHLDLRGELAAACGAFESAEASIRSALDLRKQLAAKSRATGRDHLMLGRIYAGQGRAADAIAAYRLGLAVIAKSGESLSLHQIAPFLDTLMAGGAPGPATVDAHRELFEAAQLVRNPIAAQAIAKSVARLSERAEIGELVRRRDQALRRRDRLNQEFVAASADGGQRARARRETLVIDLAALEKDLGELDLQLQAAYPNYNQLLDAPVKARNVLDALRPGEVLVQVLLGAEDGFVLAARDGRIAAGRIALTETEAALLVARIRDGITVREGSIGAFDLEAAHELYGRIFSPVAPMLAGARHLITVQSGALLSLPFAMLVTSPPPVVEWFDYSAVAFLVRGLALSISPSVRNFVDLRKLGPSKAPKPLIAFGNFDPVGDAAIIQRARNMPAACREAARLIAEAPRLDDTVRDVSALANRFGAGAEDRILGAQFSERRIRETRLRDYRILLFATHGFLPRSLDCLPEPGLLVSRPPARAAASDDGVLSASEIIALDLDADLVILSACDTGGQAGRIAGVAERTGGESLSGLARAFFTAGARALLVSHWTVESEATVKLMELTFGHRTGIGKTPELAPALRDAQLRMLGDSRRSHPFFWAPFTLVGDGGLRVVVAPYRATARLE